MKLNKATDLAPGVPNYHNNLAQVYLAYQLRADTLIEPNCSQQADVPYSVCLGVQSLESNLRAVAHQPFYYRSKIALGNSAFNLGLHESAIDYYSQASMMVPNAWPVRNDLAESQIIIGRYDEALKNLETSLSITGKSTESLPALLLKSKALKEIGEWDEAIATLKRGISFGKTLPDTLQLIQETHQHLGVTRDIPYFDQIIEKNPLDASAHYSRGLAHLALGNSVQANLDVEKSFTLGLDTVEVRAALGYTRLKTNEIPKAKEQLSMVLDVNPQNALYQTYYGELLTTLGHFPQAVERLAVAAELDPESALTQLILGQTLFSMGEIDSAKEIFQSSNNSQLPTPQHYADRAQIYAFFGMFDLAISDLDKAITRDPLNSDYLDSRTRMQANLNSTVSDNPNSGLTQLNLSKTILSLDVGINRHQAWMESVKEVIESSKNLELPTPQHYADRGEIYAFFGLTGLATADLGEAIRMDPLNLNYLHSRMRIQANADNFKPALNDINSVIQIEPNVAKYFVDRGVIHHRLGETTADLYKRRPYLDLSVADFERAQSIGEVDIPPPDARTKLYFGINPNVYYEFNTQDIVNEKHKWRAVTRDIPYFDQIIEKNPLAASAH